MEGSQWDRGEPGQGLRGAPGAMTGVGTQWPACRSGCLASSVALAAEGKSSCPQFSGLTAHAQCRGFGQAKISKDSLPAQSSGSVTGRALCLYLGDSGWDLKGAKPPTAGLGCCGMFWPLREIAPGMARNACEACGAPELPERGPRCLFLQF